MNNVSEDANALKLKAWNEWKVECAIFKCSPENSKLLANEVGNAFRKKIMYYCHEYLPILKGHDADHDETQQESENMIFAHEFDIALEVKAKAPGENKHTGKEKEKKFYKDIAWTAMENSSEPPLKVVRGMLLGGCGNHCAPLNMIVLEFLERNYGYKYIIDIDNKRRINKPISTNTPIEGEDGGTTEFGDFIADLCTPSEIQPSDQKFLEEEIPKILSSQEMAVFLAESSSMALTQNELLQFIGLNKTMAYEKSREAKKKILNLLKGNFDRDDMPYAFSYIIKIIFSKLKAEKPSSEFLCMVQKMNPEL